ncbi:hypothetical protein EV361DRAFT_983147 [Lentinula raphanica]|nr:hypothetical protein EV361DRAFT_983147 [Lentinula raphanica]
MSALRTSFSCLSGFRSPSYWWAESISSVFQRVSVKAIHRVNAPGGYLEEGKRPEPKLRWGVTGCSSFIDDATQEEDIEVKGPGNGNRNRNKDWKKRLIEQRIVHDLELIWERDYYRLAAVRVAFTCVLTHKHKRLSQKSWGFLDRQIEWESEKDWYIPPVSKWAP